MKKNKRIGDIICYVSFAIGIIGLVITQSTRVGMIIFTIGLVISCPFYRKYNMERKVLLKEKVEKE